MVRISKTLVAGISALAMAAVVLPTAPALAGGWGGGGWAGRGVWHGGYWRGGYWNNGWWGPAVAAGVLTGAAIASYPYWGDDCGGGCWQVRPTYDAFGNVLGQLSVNVC